MAQDKKKPFFWSKPVPVRCESCPISIILIQQLSVVDRTRYSQGRHKRIIVVDSQPLWWLQTQRAPHYPDEQTINLMLDLYPSTKTHRSAVRCDRCLMMCPGLSFPPASGSVLSGLSPSSLISVSSCLSLLLLLLSPLAGSRGSGPPSSHHWLSTHLCGTASWAYVLSLPPFSPDHPSEVV